MALGGWSWWKAIDSDDAKSKMNKPQLSDYDISDYQYSKYKEYKDRVEKINDYFNLFVIIIVNFIVAFFVVKFFTDNFSKATIGSVIGIIVLYILCIYPIALACFLGSIIYHILSFIKIPNLIIYIYSLYYKQTQREVSFANIETFEKNLQEFERRVFLLEFHYPGIAKYNYDKRLYFENILNKILEYEKEYINNIIKQRNLKKQEKYWLDLDGITFEKEVTDLYRKLGYKAETTKASGDGGVDIKLWDNKGEYTIVQCKNHKDKVGPSIARDLYGTMQKEKANKAILLCSGGFNKGVFDFVKDLPIRLMDIKQLIELSETIYPPLNTIGKISDYSCLGNDRNYFLKNIENVFILCRCYEKFIEINGKKRFINPIDNEFCVFETSEKVKREVEIIKKQINDPTHASYVYEVAEWETQNHKIFYYLRIFAKEQSYFSSKKINEYKGNFRQKTRKYKKWWKGRR